MVAKISIKADVRGVALTMTRIAREAIPKAERAAVNALAFDVMRAERAATKEVFKNPRPFTQKAFLVEQAKAGMAPEAMVYARPEAEKYLAPYEFGGNHALPGQAALIPIDQSTDAYGQLPKGIMARLTGRKDIFVGKVNGLMGVWQRINVTRAGNAKRTKQRGNAYHPQQGQLKLLIMFGDNTPVTAHLDFAIRARSIVQARFMATFRNALAKALKA